MENETQGQAAPPAIEPKKEKNDSFVKIIGGLVGILVILGIFGTYLLDEEGGGRGGWQYTGKKFVDVFRYYPEDEGMVYIHDGAFIKVLHATKHGNLVQSTYWGEKSERVIWVETPGKRYEDGQLLGSGYYVRRGLYEYETALGVEKTVARYVQITDKSILAKIQKEIENARAAAEVKAKAAAEAEAKAKAAEAKAKAEAAAAKAKAKAEAEAKAKAQAEAEAKARAEIAEVLQVGKTPGETKIITLSTGATVEMVWCPPGTFTMGSFQGSFEEGPHQVTLSKGFWMGKTEVTQAQWKNVMGNNPSQFQGDDLPVENVTWNDCQEFCRKTGFQLPTEAEWEYACRAGSTGPYAGTGKLDEMGWYNINSGGKMHPVGTKQPNAWGLYDMHGNVWEWCADRYGDYPDGAVMDPQGASSGARRVRRGGDWKTDASYCTSSCRSGIDPSSAYNDLGFRLVRTLSE